MNFPYNDAKNRKYIFCATNFDAQLERRKFRAPTVGFNGEVIRCNYKKPYHTSGKAVLMSGTVSLSVYQRHSPCHTS